MRRPSVGDFLNASILAIALSSLVPVCRTYRWSFGSMPKEAIDIEILKHSSLGRTFRRLDSEAK